MHKLTFFPLGNADCCRIDLHDGRKLLFDYANLHDPNDTKDLRIDLAKALLDNLKESKRGYYDVVAFTHADDDHIHGFSDFFYLEHAQKYQDKGRIKIGELWVPAAVVIEENLEDEAKILRAEARYRIKEKKGIRIFSRPDRLKEWFKQENLNIDDYRNLITDAGQLVPGFEKRPNSVEFFVHSPFAKHVDDALIDRNEASLVLQATFDSNDSDTKLILSADTQYEVWQDIVAITKAKKREERLQWNIFKLPHHCSYLSVGPEKGKEKTDPVKEVKWLYRQGINGAIIISPSKPIPTDDKDDQPPHRQTANYYKEVISKIGGRFIVTMEYPNVTKPEPFIVTIDVATDDNAARANFGPVPVVINTNPPRPWCEIG